MEHTNFIPRKFSEVTPSMIQDWKAKHNLTSLEQIDIINDGVTYSFIIKKPSRTAVDLMAQKGIDREVVETNKILIANTVLGGDLDAMEADGGIYQALLQKLTLKVKDYQATVKKL
ncbi:hypothetical protein D3C72_344490 [compost metagenome]